MKWLLSLFRRRKYAAEASVLTEFLAEHKATAKVRRQARRCPNTGRFLKPA